MWIATILVLAIWLTCVWIFDLDAVRATFRRTYGGRGVFRIRKKRLPMGRAREKLGLKSVLGSQSIRRGAK